MQARPDGPFNVAKASPGSRRDLPKFNHMRLDSPLLSAPPFCFRNIETSIYQYPKCMISSIHVDSITQPSLLRIRRHVRERLQPRLYRRRRPGSPYTRRLLLLPDAPNPVGAEEALPVRSHLRTVHDDAYREIHLQYVPLPL